MNLPEAVVATSALAIFTSVSLQSFTSSMKVVGSAKVRDDVSAVISSDLAKIRRAADEWKLDTTTVNSEGITTAAEINYCEKDENDPTDLGCDEMCANGTIALDFLKDGDTEGLLPTEDYGSVVDNTSSWTRTKSDIMPENKKVTLTRTISSESSNYNLLKVSYVTSSTIMSNSNSTSTIIMPAQAWCNS